jgi:hypothetical protein
MGIILRSNTNLEKENLNWGSLLNSDCKKN